MTQQRATSGDGERRFYHKALDSSYYALLGLHPSASVREIRQAYRELSKLYHPDTTSLAPAIATAKFQELNEAYATLSSPERRLSYDQKIGYSQVAVVQPLPSLNQPPLPKYDPLASAYLDPTDRPLSAGEVFALFILGLTFFACLALAITLGITRGDSTLQPIAPPNLEGPGAVAPLKTSLPSTPLHPELTVLMEIPPIQSAPPILAPLPDDPAHPDL